MFKRGSRSSRSVKKLQIKLSFNIYKNNLSLKNENSNINVMIPFQRREKDWKRQFQ